MHLLHSCGRERQQVEQPLPIGNQFWPVDLQGGGACQAISQVDYLLNKSGVFSVEGLPI